MDGCQQYPRWAGTRAEGLVGRVEELALIDAFLKGSAAEGGVLLLTGEPGVGKTALLDLAEDRALSSGTRVLRGAGVDFEADLDYAGLHQILLPLEAELELLDAGQRGVLSAALGLGAGSVPDRAQVSEAAFSLLRRVRVARPLLVIVDDAHKLDEASAEVLGFVSRSAAGSSIGLLAASRSGADSFFGRVGLPECEVRNLGDEAAACLLRTRFPALAPRVQARLVSEAQGNVLALLELGSEAGGLHLACGRVPAGVAPARPLRTLFAARVSELPASARELLLRAALDATGDPRVLRSAPVDDPDPGALEAVEKSGLVRMDRDSHRTEFSHPLIRSVVLKQATSSELRVGHRALAQLLADQPERRAWHLAAAAVEPDDQVADLLDEVARCSMRRGDAVGAVAALLRSAELSPHGVDRSRRMAEAAYMGASVTGELRDAPRLLTAAHEADPEHGESLYTALAAAYVLLAGEGDVDAAHQLLVGAVEGFSVRDAADERVLNEAIGTLFLVCCFGGRAELWERLPEVVTRAAPDVLLSLCRTAFHDPVRARVADLEYLDRLIEKSGEEIDPTRIVRLATAGMFVDRLAGLRAALWRVVEDGRQGGAVTSGINGLLLLGFDDFMAGRWDEADAVLEEGLRRCEARGYGFLALPGRFVQALLAAGRGDFKTADRLVDDITGWAAPRGIRLAQIYGYRVRTLAALARGDYEDAYRQATAISPAGTFAPGAPSVPHVLLDLVESAIGTNRRAEADAHVAAMREADIATVSPRLALIAAGCAAIAASGDAATGLYEQALAVPGAERWAFDFARVRLAYGEHLRRSRAIATSRVQLEAAVAAFESMGARPWATRARNELRATAENRSRTDSAGPGSLTPREREIAQLAVSGLSNKQIGEQLRLSARTVGAHLHHIFQKLGVSSRVALREALGPVPVERVDERLDENP